MSANANAIIDAALSRLDARQCRAVEAVAAGRRVASPLSEGEVCDMMNRLAVDEYERDVWTRYYALLDALAALQAPRLDVSRQEMEQALQGAWEREARP